MRHFFVRGQYFGAVAPSWERVHATLHYATGRALFCPICSEVWANFPVDSQETYVDHIICEKHDASPSRPFPGCILSPWTEDFNKDVPTELLAREFLLMYDIRKKNGTYKV